MFAPPLAQSFVKRIPMNPKSFSPLCNSEGFSLMGNSAICSRITHLLGSGRPTTIIGAIAKIIVNPFKRHALLRLTHIRKKIGEIEPAITEFNSPRAVMFICRVIRVAATLLYPKPNAMQFSPSFAVLRVSFMKVLGARAASLTMQASAGLRHASFKVVAPNCFSSAAVAKAQTIFAGGLNSKSTKALANNNRVIFFSRHKFSSIMRINYNTNNRRLSNAF
jgi:hypothetical protein